MKKADEANKYYWNDLAEVYQSQTCITLNDFHYGPLIPGDAELKQLPDVQGKTCLEIGSGAGQNSIFLKKQGAARCVALDVSGEQLRIGEKLAKKEGVDVEFIEASMDALPPLGKFDFIHSTYALPFSEDPALVIRQCANMLNEGGTLLLTTGHPLHSAEWLEVGDDEEGLFIADYFSPPPDVRVDADDPTNIIQAVYANISTVSGWLADAGFLIERVLEPKAMPIDQMAPETIAERVPYWSEAWLAEFEQLCRCPIVVVFKAIKR